MLLGFEQHIKCHTTKTEILECSGNVKDAYAAIAKPPQANSDSNIVHLMPKALKRSNPLVKPVNVWSDDSFKRLKVCFLCTEWDTFSEKENLRQVTEVTTDFSNSAPIL